MRDAINVYNLVDELVIQSKHKPMNVRGVLEQLLTVFASIHEYNAYECRFEREYLDMIDVIDSILDDINGVIVLYNAGVTSIGDTIPIIAHMGPQRMKARAQTVAILCRKCKHVHMVSGMSNQSMYAPVTCRKCGSLFMCRHITFSRSLKNSIRRLQASIATL